MGNVTMSTPQSTNCYSHYDCSPSAPFCYSYSGPPGYCTDCSICEYCHEGIDGTCGSGCGQTTWYGATCSPAPPSPPSGGPSPPNTGSSGAACNSNSDCDSSAPICFSFFGLFGGGVCTTVTSDYSDHYGDYYGGYSYYSYYQGCDQFCNRHSDCPSSSPFCHGGCCDTCDECHYCSDGIDDTCGPSCGHPLYGAICAPVNWETSAPISAPIISPTAIPTLSPTVSSIPAFQIASIKPGSKLFVPTVLIIGIDVVIFILCVAYLLCFSNLLKKTQMPGTATVMDTIKMLGTANIVAVLLEVIDIVTDFLFSFDLITNANELGWIALMSAILGLLLFGMKMVLTKKLIGFQEYNLERQLERTTDSSLIIRITKTIREARMELDILSLLIACLEDVPQALIVTLMVMSTSEWDFFGLLNLSLAVISFNSKLLQIVLSKCGCKDTSSIKRMSRVSNVVKLNVASSASTIPMVKVNAEGQKIQENVQMVKIVPSPICLAAEDYSYN